MDVVHCLYEYADKGGDRQVKSPFATMLYSRFLIAHTAHHTWGLDGIMYVCVCKSSRQPRGTCHNGFLKSDPADFLPGHWIHLTSLLPAISY